MQMTATANPADERRQDRLAVGDSIFMPQFMGDLSWQARHDIPGPANM
jgi:hypothetical protein